MAKGTMYGIGNSKQLNDVTFGGVSYPADKVLTYDVVVNAIRELKSENLGFDKLSSHQAAQEIKTLLTKEHGFTNISVQGSAVLQNGVSIGLTHANNDSKKRIVAYEK